MEQPQPESDTGSTAGLRARWATLDPAARRRILWITTMVVILLIVVAVFALGAAPRCTKC
jgi:hypothetical protein